MLLWLESSIARRLFAEMQESPDEPAEFRQRLKILVCKLSLHHVHIISYYDLVACCTFPLIRQTICPPVKIRGSLFVSAKGAWIDPSLYPPGNGPHLVR